MNTTDPQQFYTTNGQSLTEKLAKLNRVKNQLAWLRFAAVITALFSAWMLRTEYWLLPFSTFIFFTGLFIYFLIRDINNNNAIENIKRLITVNGQELLFLQHRFQHLPDGSEFQNPLHPYANDLDIFGKASLYQYVNRTVSQQGNTLLAQWLTSPTDAGTVKLRQEAAEELAAQASWRQQLQAYGMASPIQTATQQKIADWLNEPGQFRNKLHWKIIRFLFPMISFGLLALYLTGIIASSLFLFLITLMMFLSFGISKLVLPMHSRLSKIAPEAATLSESVAWIEELSCTGSYLPGVKEKFNHPPYKASAQIRSLGRILERFDYRLNFVVFIPLNTFLCWDLQQVFALERWKEENKARTGEWFSGLAETEALCSLANIRFNHPEWVFPAFSDKEAVLESIALGHPLIPSEKRVCSDYSTAGAGQISLVTGSNMAGKSTFLRSVGVNIVLAMSGAPVCARSFTLSPMKVMSSMRISDNLEESTSTFYAELKKLKEIIEAVNRKEKVFLLLDEILRGTNSADRHTGSNALIRQLILHKASGIMATHDLELAKLANEYPSGISNYHFDVQVANDELFFDYKLKQGVCTSMNASILMKKIGIEL